MEDSTEMRQDDAQATKPRNEEAVAEQDRTSESNGPEDGTQLFAPDERQDLESRWNDVQSRFVDEPRTSVEEANELVGELMERLVSGFQAQRTELEEQWDRGDDVTTEDLRVALQRYRTFFARLLEVPGER
jgi:hypothetical protein